MGNHKGAIYKSKVWVVEDKENHNVLYEYEGKISELLYWFYLEYPDDKRYKLQTFKKHFNVYSKQIQ